MNKSDFIRICAEEGIPPIISPSLWDIWQKELDPPFLNDTEEDLRIAVKGMAQELAESTNGKAKSN